MRVRIAWGAKAQSFRAIAIAIALVVPGAGGSAHGQAGKGKAPNAPAPRPQKPSYDGRTGLAEPSLAALVSASNRNDRNEVIRLSERVGVARLASVLTSGANDRDRPQVLAALDAARYVEGGIRLLAVVARLVRDDDARVAERAARAVGELLRADKLEKVIEWEVTADDVYGACSVLAGIAALGEASSPVRIAALEALGEAHAYCKGNLPLGGVVGDSAPEIRRAALLAPQMREAQPLDAIAALIEDPVPLVAGAAATVWCRLAYNDLRKGAVNNDAEKLRLFRLRMLVLADVAPPEDSAEILPCLALSKDPEDQKAVESVRKRLAQAPVPRW